MSTIYIVLAYNNSMWGLRDHRNRDEINEDALEVFTSFRKAEDSILNKHSGVVTIRRGLGSQDRRVDFYEAENHDTYQIHRRGI